VITSFERSASVRNSLLAIVAMKARRSAATVAGGAMGGAR
jgi:hypothetical protein